MERRFFLFASLFSLILCGACCSCSCIVGGTGSPSPSPSCICTRAWPPESGASCLGVEASSHAALWQDRGAWRAKREGVADGRPSAVCLEDCVRSADCAVQIVKFVAACSAQGALCAIPMQSSPHCAAPKCRSPVASRQPPAARRGTICRQTRESAGSKPLWLASCLPPTLCTNGPTRFGGGGVNLARRHCTPLPYWPAGSQRPRSS